MTADDTREALHVRQLLIKAKAALSLRHDDAEAAAYDAIADYLAAARHDPEPVAACDVCASFGHSECDGCRACYERRWRGQHPSGAAIRGTEARVPVTSADAARCPVTDMPHDLMCVNCGHREAAIRGTEDRASLDVEALAKALEANTADFIEQPESFETSALVAANIAAHYRAILAEADR